MMHVSDDSQVTDNQAGSRLELRADGRLAELRYRRNGRRLVLIHTEVPPELEGRGTGGALMSAATWCTRPRRADTSWLTIRSTPFRASRAGDPNRSLSAPAPDSR